MSRRAIFAILLSLFGLRFTHAADAVKHVDADEAAKLIASGKVTVLDVRTRDEFDEGHIQHAQNIDFTQDGFAEKAAKLDKSKPILVHCQAGSRSTRSLPDLQKLGVPIYHLDGGINAWLKAGKPVVK
jgi:rhodanese-related sulfurtransferase